ncbi:hypothetical protein AL036_17170 [Salipiger aestuarii]|uniref:hypothetical protein n=1 Tax=Salipiger aestuarii TaxID=568098 RepID=UPI000DB93901|nr:hypothetical protein [Salipiger aestuarii]KAA8605850.1 hypothetical protein AL036_17170 [Salipiger aestuarii]KAA8605891.1 hypothetical protein AL037_21010 [Salipiger aestuarii]KAB2540661.1 hypothetical protein AL035_16345 [Salipiger aestuarii]
MGSLALPGLPLTGDDRINAAEAEGGIAIAGTATSGDSVSVGVFGRTPSTTVGEGATRAVLVPGGRIPPAPMRPI